MVEHNYQPYFSAQSIIGGRRPKSIILLPGVWILAQKVPGPVLHQQDFLFAPQGL